MSVVEILRQARELIADKSRWTQKHYARTVKGRPIGPSEGAATCWCAEGAIMHQNVPTIEKRHAVEFLNMAAIHLLHANIVCVNDGGLDGIDDPHAAVLSVFDFAIERREAANA